MFREIQLRLSTLSQYFRFGFKMRTPEGPLFGDGGVKSSSDTNMLVHIGRNRRSSNLFFTSYRNGVREALDKKILVAPQLVSVPIHLTVDDEAILTVSVADIVVYNSPIKKEVRAGLVMLAWGDADEFEVVVKKMRLLTTRI